MLCKHTNRTRIRSEPRPCGYWWIVERCEDCGKWLKRAEKEPPQKRAAEVNDYGDYTMKGD